MYKKIFVVSDVHGFYSLLESALRDVGFEKNNPEHLLVCCGDYFDRGTENFNVLKFFESLENKVLLRGNHEDMLLEIFETGKIKPHNYLNGTIETITEFFGKYCIDPTTDEIDFSGKTRILERLTDFILQTQDYFETSNYVFTHGWLPVKISEGEYHIDPNWRNATNEEWKKARWTRWTDMFNSCDRLIDKRIVCGHVPAFSANAFDNTRTSDNADVFITDGLIVVDAGTYTSKQLNVFVVTDEL